MKGVFFNGAPERLFGVFSVEEREKLKEMGVTDKIYNRADLERMGEVEYIFSSWGMISLTEEEIRKYLPKLRAVFYAAGSVKYFAEPFLKAGVKVFSAWQANAVPVAEYAVAQILLANKGYYRLSRLCKKNYDEARALVDTYAGNFGAKVGILGYGAIAKLVVRELIKHDLQVYVFAPDITENEASRLGVKKATLEEIFSECDVISNHLANNEQTVGMINGNLIGKMKPLSTFINTGRGTQVDEKGLIEKLEQDETVTAILDVTDPEPPLLNSKFYTLENVILTPHLAGSSGKETQRMAAYMIEEAKRFISGKETRYEVTLPMLATMA